MSELKHLEAFEFYYALGSDRNLKSVAQKFNKGVRTVEGWASKEKWQDEVRNRNFALVRANRDNNLLAQQEEAKDYKKLARALLGQYMEKIKKEQIEIKSVGDLERLVNVIGKLNGWVDSAGAFADGVLDIADGVGTQPEGVKLNGQTIEGIDIVLDIEGGAEDYE